MRVPQPSGREDVATPAVRRPLLLLVGAGVGGGAWSALVHVAATPFYLRFLGVEGYALVGFYTALHALLQVLDLGALITVSRDVARLSAENRRDELRAFVRTFEVLYWLVAIVIGGVLVMSSSLVARSWFHQAQIDPAELQRAVALMGVLWAAQWLTGFYSAVLIGFERLVELNVFRAFVATALHAGGALWLIAITPTVSALFLYQSAIAALGLLGVVLLSRRALPACDERPRFRLALLASRGRFAASLAAISICGTLLAQADKIIVSRLLSLRELGFYALASMAATSLFIAVVPLFHAVMPRLSALAATGSKAAIADLYRGALQGVTVLAVAPAAVLLFFAEDVIALWTRSPEIGRNTAAIVALLVAGSALNAIMTPAYALQLATGHTRLALIAAVCELTCFIPLVIILASRYGAVGAAAAWSLVHAGYVAIGLPLTHVRVLGESAGAWLQETVPPAAAAVLVAAAASYLAPEDTAGAWRLLYIVISSAAVLAVAILFAPRVRTAALTFVRRSAAP